MRDGGTTPTLITERAPTTMAGAGRTRTRPDFGRASEPMMCVQFW